MPSGKPGGRSGRVRAPRRQHALSDASHALDADLRGGAGNHHRLLEVDEQGIAELAQPPGLRPVVRRQCRPRPASRGRRGVRELPDEVSEVLRVVTIEADDGVDAFAHLGAPPFLGDIVVTRVGRKRLDRGGPGMGKDRQFHPCPTSRR